VALGDLLPHGFVAIERVPGLVHVGQLHRLAHPHFAAISLLFPREDFKQGGFSLAVGTNNADDAALWYGETQVFEQQAVTEALFQVLYLNYLVPQSRAGGDIDFIGFVAVLEFLGLQFFKSLQARLALGLTTLRVAAYPLQLGLNGFLVRGLLSFFLLQSLLLGIQPVGVITLIGNTPTPVQLKNPASCVVQEIAVVGDGHNRAGKVVQKTLEPGDTLRIQVVSRLVQ